MSRTAETYPPMAMKPAWPMENWPVRPFTRLSETARMMAIPMWLMFWNAYSQSRWSAKKYCTSQSTGMAAMKGSQLSRARRACVSAEPPKRPAI